MDKSTTENSGKIDKRGSLYSMGKYKLPFLFLLPTFLFLLLFLAIPLFLGIYMSFEKIFLNGTVKFVWFHNYQVLISESRFINNFKLSLLYVVGNIALTTPLAYGAALLVTSKLR
ncbi:sugar ABC transporter permease, partial [Candidatus Aerophobetes bacterium]|nr:sugar ABC transporter permease [Candidatus Aerophobetes bacterium]